MQIQKINDRVMSSMTEDEFTILCEGAKLAIEELNLLSKGEAMTEVDQMIAAIALNKLNSIKVENNQLIQPIMNIGENSKEVRYTAICRADSTYESKDCGEDYELAKKTAETYRQLHPEADYRVFVEKTIIQKTYEEIDTDYYDVPFKYGNTEVCRGDLEGLPCPMCTSNVTDVEMQIIATEVEAVMKEWFDWKEQGDITEERYWEKWWEVLENTAVAYKVPYYEDMD